MWLTTYDEHGHPHMLRADELHLHGRGAFFTVSVAADPLVRPVRRLGSGCACNPRFVRGCFMHRTLNRSALYTPLKGGGH